jgi:putative cell wall-binding protein
LRRALLALTLLVAFAAPASRAAAQESTTTTTTTVPADDVHGIVFPVIGDVHYTDTFGAARSGGRRHEGQDLLGEKMMQLVAADSGTIEGLVWPEASYGNYLKIRADDGYVYSYVHINNDTPGTDDNSASREYVYADGIDNGVHVERGQLVAYMGDSGNAESTQPHLHFEMHRPDGSLMNPFDSLNAAQHLDQPAGETVEPSPIPRLAGEDRVATSVAVSERGWPGGSPTAVIAAGDEYAEALPASVLAGRDAPLLLVTGTHLPTAVADELERLHATSVTVVGSVPSTMDAELSDASLDVRRIGSAGDSVATSVAIANDIGGAAGVAVLVNRSSFADGVSAAALAAGRGWPILLSDSDLIPQRTVDEWRALGVHRVVLVGGTAALGANIETFVRDKGRCAGGAGCKVERVAGRDRYATSVAAASAAVAAGDRTLADLLLGTGTAYPDALAAGPLAARLGGVTVLVDGSGRMGDAASRSFLSEHRDAVGEVAILGGAGAVTSAADRAIQEALGLS